MNKVIKLEEELIINTKRLRSMPIEAADTKEYRALLIQRSYLKDLLIEAYREATQGVAC